MPKPQTVLCYICGREFGSYSINVHERQCAKRWESQRNKDKQQAEKRDQKKRNALQESREKLHDPWVKRYEPPVRLKPGNSKSMIDISKVSNEEVHSINGDDVSNHNQDFCKVSRPATATVSRYTSSLLPSKMNANTITKTKPGGNTKSLLPNKMATNSITKANIEGTSTSLLPNKIDPNKITRAKTEDIPKPDDNDDLTSLALSRKNSAPEPSTTACSSPDSSTSSQVSSESLPTPEVSPPRFRSTKNPNLLVCYICGNEFGSKSLKIHEPQCLKKWRLANPRYYSRKGNHGGMFKADSTNSLQKATGLKSKPGEVNRPSSVKSASCENLLESGLSGNKHAPNSLQALKELSKSHGRLYQPHKPKMEPCYICGKEVIKHSLEVHEKQCRKKWDAIKTKSEKEEKEKRKYLASSPSKRHSANIPVSIKVDQVKDVQNNNIDEGQKENHASNEVQTKAISKERKPSTITCYLCGRAYGTASISIHEKQCLKKWEAAESAKTKGPDLRGPKKTKPRPKSFVL